MAIRVGTKLGPYEVQGLAGSGGMGEVYRAHDSRLDRLVAVKVLPESVAGDEDRLRRFEQEARVIAALNHPNILSIHDSGALDGTRYIVTELLEGDTLRQRLSGGPLPVRKAVDYGLQVCRGLAAAHEKGIVHRDLKPENLFITRDGRVKVLDFGLAKLSVEAAASAATITESGSVGSSPGTVVGTAGYMSPEQVRGKPVDQRTDIFAFGAVLYEMLSGKRAFHGDTTADTMSSILKDDPPDLTETNRNLPPGLERIVRHCLEKNPEERFQSAHDIAFALDALTGMGSSSSGKAAKIDIAPRVKVRMAAAVAAAVVALALGIAIGLRAGRTTPPKFRPVTFRLGSIGAARFTPDGDIVYSAAWAGKGSELYVGKQNAAGDRPLGLADAEVLAISATGQIAVLLNRINVSENAFRGTLALVSLSGGAPRPVLDNVQYADFSPDGNQLAVTRVVESTGAWRIEYPAGKVLYETQEWPSDVRVSPDGKHVAFFDHPAPVGDDRGGVAVLDLQGRKTTLSSGWSSLQGLVWHGDEIWFTGVRAGTSRQLFAVTLSGKVRQLLSAPSNLVVQDIGSKGQVLMRSENTRLGVLGVAPGETRERELGWFNWSLVRDITPDGKTILLEEEGDAGGSNYLIFSRGTDGSPAVRLGEGAALRFSPDAKWALGALPDSGAPLRIIPTGTGEPRDITHDNMDHGSAAWLPDSKQVMFVGIQRGHAPRNYIVNIDTGEQRPVTEEGTRGTVLSPDGKRCVVRTREGTIGVWTVGTADIHPIKGLEQNEFVFRWAGDGKMLYVTRHMQEHPRKIYLLDPVTGKRQLWKSLAPADLTGVVAVAAPVISRDGRAYAYMYAKSLADLYIVEGVK